MTALATLLDVGVDDAARIRQMASLATPMALRVAVTLRLPDRLPDEDVDAYLLCDVLHNWDDEHAHRIMSRCAQAARATSRILVIEPVGGRRAQSEFDLAMLVIFGGRERHVDEFRALAGAHGLVLDSVNDLTGQRCLLEFTLAADQERRPGAEMDTDYGCRAGRRAE